jgi:hydrogenase maturation factor
VTRLRSRPDGPGSAGPPERCITCGDHAVAMRIVSVEPSAALAICHELGAVEHDRRADEETVDLGLLGEVGVGEVVLVHAGTALARLATVEPAA